MDAVPDPADTLPPDIIIRARAYDHAALTQLFDATYDGAYRFAHALCDDPAVAAGAVDAALERGLDRLAEFGGEPAALQAWMVELTRESIRRRPRPPGGGRVREALGRLGDLEHQSVTLRVLGGFGLATIATACARRQSSVESTLLSGLRALGNTAGRLSGAGAARQLDAALERLAGGAPAAEAATSAPALQEAPALLEAAAGVRELTGQEPAAAIRARARVHFLAEADARRTHWVHRHHVVADVPGRRPRKARPVLTTMSLGFALLLALVAGVVLAIASAIATPSSSVYPLKRAAEDMLVALTPDRITRASLQVKLAEQRRVEAETDAAGHHPTAALVAVEARYDELRAAARDLEAVHRRTRAWTDARDRLEAEAQQSPDALVRLLNSTGGRAQAARLTADEKRFQHDRQEFDKLIAPAATTAPSGPTTTTVAPTPTPPH